MMIGQFIAIPSSEAAPPATSCAEDARAAIAAACQSLAANDNKDDRTTLACLVEAVAALDEKIQGLMDGSVPFEGQIHAPKGIVMIKPSVQEGR